MCVVLGCFWSLHSHSSIYSDVTAEIDVCCHYLCENQDIFIGCSLDASLPTAFTIWGHLCTLAKEESLFPRLPQLYCEVLGAQRCIQGAFIELALVQYSCVSPDRAV